MRRKKHVKKDPAKPVKKKEVEAPAKAGYIPTELLTALLENLALIKLNLEKSSNDLTFHANALNSIIESLNKISTGQFENKSNYIT